MKKACRFLLIAAALLLLCIAGDVTADTESPLVAQYRKRVDESVDKGLAYLAKNQIPQGQPLAGSFLSEGLPGDTGVTSLCTMAFLSKGYTPGLGPHGEQLNHAVDYVLSRYRSSDDLIVGPRDYKPMYAHCMSTLMLAEVSGMVDTERQKQIDFVLPKALRLLVSAQRVVKGPTNAGGWRYTPRSTDSDISHTGWAMMALRAARLNGATIPKDCIDVAKRYIMKCRTLDGGFAYMPAGGQAEAAGVSGLARTGIAVLMLELCGNHGDPATIAGGEYILRNMPRTATPQYYAFYYGEYYCSQAMFQLGGKYWEAWAPAMYDMLFKAQAADGSWPTSLDNTAGGAGSCYSTAMAVLAMTVTYRQLPSYQR